MARCRSRRTRSRPSTTGCAAGQALVVGLAFGELMRQECPFEWVRATGGGGSETGLGLGDFPITCFPISMIRIRLREGWPADLELLASETATAWLGSASRWFERRAERHGYRS